MAEASPEAAVRDVLAAASGVTDLVGTDPARIWESDLPVGWTAPAITYGNAGTPFEAAHDGATGLAVARVQVDCWARTKAQARDLAEKANAALDGYAGDIASVRVKKVNRVFRLGPRQEPDPATFRVIVDYRVAYDTTALV